MLNAHVKTKVSCVVNTIVKKSRLECKHIPVFAFVTLIISLCLQVFMTNRLSIRGSEMADLQDKKAQLERQVQTLQLETSRYSALSYVEGEAKRLGFIEQEGKVNIIDPSSLTAASY